MHEYRGALDLREEPPGGAKPQNPRWPFFLIGVIVVVGTTAFIRWTHAPKFSEEIVIEIPVGYSVRDIARLLHEKNVIRSTHLFELAIDWSDRESVIPAGTYVFKKPENVFAVARRFVEGDHGITRIKVTLPEGVTVRDVLTITAKTLPRVSPNEADAFLHKEGYLFPDTYFFFTTATTGDVIAAMEKNFFERTADLRKQAEREGKRWEDVVIMASLIEREAATDTDRMLISGILWKRLKIGMPLQVDATFMYLLGKSSAELTVDDLNMDSPYNTYRNKGLPPAPIANPGRASLLAALSPKESPYLYYLSGADGIMHYAKTFEEHKLNKEKYLP